MAYNQRKISVGWWKDQIQAGIRFREQSALEARWEDWRRYYRGEWKSGILPLNLFFMTLRALVPRVYFKDPAVSISPAMPGMVNAIFAQILERVDNKLIVYMGVKKQIKKMIQDAFLFGTGVGTLGYGSLYQMSPNSGITQAPFSRTRGNFEYQDRILANMPWFLRVHPGNYILPDGCEDQDEARWEAIQVDRPLLDVKNDPRFKNTSDLKPTRERMVMQGDRSTAVHKPVEMIRLYQVRDKKYEQCFVISEAHEKVLYEGQDDLTTYRGFPSFPLVFNNDDENFWGVADSVIIEPQQLEINEIRTQMMKHRRLTLIKLLYEKGQIEPHEIAKMTDEQVMAAIGVSDIAAVKPIQQAGIPDDLYRASEEVRMDHREQVGFSRNQFADAAPSSSRTTATEAAIVQKASEIRVDERQDIVADMMTKMIDCMHNVIFQYWGQEQVVDVVGPGGIPIWVEFSGKMLKGGAFEVHVEPDVGMPMTKQAREQRAVQTYSMLKDNPLVDPIGLTRYLLRELHGVQYDDLIRGLPQGAGQAAPLNIGQYAQLMQNARRLRLPGGGQQTARQAQKGGGNAKAV